MRFVLLVFMLLAISACQNKEDKKNAETQDYHQELLSIVHIPPKPLEDFSLTTLAGDSFSFSPDKITVVYFGFTSCPDVCPLTLTELNKAYQQMNAPADKLDIVFITVDPERDTPNNIERYLGFYNEDFIGLVGSEEALAVVRDVFDVLAVKVELEDSALGYTFDHTASVFVVSPKGEVIAEFVHGATASNYVHDLELFIEHEL